MSERLPRLVCILESIEQELEDVDKFHKQYGALSKLAESSMVIELGLTPIELRVLKTLVQEEINRLKEQRQ